MLGQDKLISTRSGLVGERVVACLAMMVQASRIWVGVPVMEIMIGFGQDGEVGGSLREVMMSRYAERGRGE